MYILGSHESVEGPYRQGSGERANDRGGSIWHSNVITKCNPHTTANDHAFDTDPKIQEHSETAKNLRFYQGRSQTWLNVTRTMSQSLGISVSRGN